MFEIRKAARLIRKGELVAFPTETVYGLGANALDPKAVAKIFRAKGRPEDNPLIVHVSDEKMLKTVVKNIPEEAKELMERFWPGPLTLIFQKNPSISDMITGCLPSVAVRMPSHPVAMDLIKKSRVPIAAPSANLSGGASPTKAEHVREDFPDILVLEGGSAEYGVESTVVSLEREPKILRTGAVTIEQLKEIIPEISIAKSVPNKPASPGMKYKHYAPKKALILFMPENIEEMKSYLKKNKGAVVLCMDHHVKEFPNNEVVSLGKTNKDAAHNLFSAIRTKKGSQIAVLGINKKDHGRAVMDRLEKAASMII